MKTSMINAIRSTILVSAGASALMLAGCQSDAQTGGLIGAGLGALAGQAIGDNTTGTLIGAAVGAGAGYVIGNESDKNKARNSRYTERYEYGYGEDDRRYGDRYRHDRSYCDRCGHYHEYDHCDR